MTIRYGHDGRVYSLRRMDGYVAVTDTDDRYRASWNVELTPEFGVVQVNATGGQIAAALPKAVIDRAFRILAESR